MGGVAGHMAHLSEDTDLTFSEIIDILSKVANAEITNAPEKVDGQNTTRNKARPVQRGMRSTG